MSDKEVEARFFNAIALAPDDPSTYLVYADWLQSREDLWGDFIARQHADDPNGLGAEISRDHSIFAPLRARLLGPWADSLDERNLSWAFGFVKALTINAKHFVEQLASLGDVPSARFLRELSLRAYYNFDKSSQASVDAIVASDVLSSLRTLRLGDGTPGGAVFGSPRGYENVATVDITALCEKYQQLRCLEVVDTTLQIDQINMPNLTTLVLRLDIFPQETFDAVTGAEWPNLEKLELWFGGISCYKHDSEDDGEHDSEDDGESDAPPPSSRWTYYKGQDLVTSDLCAIFSADHTPKLKQLMLANTDFTDRVVHSLVHSKLLAQLEELDLSHGVLSDKELDEIASNHAKFMHLRRLNLSQNCLTPKAIKQLKNLGIKVIASEQRMPSRRPYYTVTVE